MEQEWNFDVLAAVKVTYAFLNILNYIVTSVVLGFFSANPRHWLGITYLN